jgi:hypothetical protein
MKSLTRTLFPIDIYSVQSFGIREWQQSFFWPVSDKEFTGLSQKIDQCYHNLIKDKDPLIQDMILLKAPVRILVFNLLHAVWVMQRLSQVHKKAHYTPWSEIFHILTDHIPYTPHRKMNGKKSGINLNLLKPLRKQIKETVWAARFIGLRLRAQAQAVSFGTIDACMSSYIMRNHIAVRLLDTAAILENVHSSLMSDDIKQRIDSITSQLSERIIKCAEQSGIELQLYHKKYINDLLLDHNLNAMRMFLHLKRLWQPLHFPAHLLAPNVGNTINRSLCLAAMHHGNKVTTFSHGGHIGLYPTPTLAFSEFSLSREFVAYTKPSSELFKRIYGLCAYERDCDCDIVSADNLEYVRLRQKLRHNHRQSRIKRIMLIGYVHTPLRRYHAAGSVSLMQLDLELRIIETLKKNQFTIIYKAHPEHLDEARAVLSHEVSIEHKPFRACINNADAYLFLSIRTTAFPDALATQKPIIAMMPDNEPYPPFPEPIALLSKRCRLIPVHPDASNRLCFDHNLLIDSCKQVSDSVDDSFFNTYYCPDK